MRKLFRAIKTNGKRIQKIEESIQTIHLLPYYSIFGNAWEKEKDLEKNNSALIDHLNERQNLIESLQLEINKELHIISQLQRKNSLKKK